MTTPAPSTHDRPGPAQPPVAPADAPVAGDGPPARAAGRRRTRPAVVPLVHPPRPVTPVRRIPPRWDDTLPGAVDPGTADTSRAAPDDEDGSLVTEYGLVAVLGATIVGLAVRWASGGAITELLGALLARVRELVGA